MSFWLFFALVVPYSASAAGTAPQVLSGSSSLSAGSSLSSAVDVASSALGAPIIFDAGSEWRWAAVPDSGVYVRDDVDGAGAFRVLTGLVSGHSLVVVESDPEAASPMAELVALVEVTSNDESAVPLSVMPVGSVVKVDYGAGASADLSAHEAQITALASAGIGAELVGYGVWYEPGHQPFSVIDEDAADEDPEPTPDPEPVLTCTTEDPCVVSVKEGQWLQLKEGMVASVIALATLSLVGLSALIGSWGRRS